MRPGEIVALIESLPEEEQILVFEQLVLPLATQIFEYCSLGTQKQLLQVLSYQKVAYILNQMSPDDRTTLLAYLPNAVVTELIKVLNEAERRVTLALLGYPDASAGRLMTPDYLAVSSDKD
jgi:magnesium transporter